MSNAAACQQAVADVGSGIAASLRGVDCVTMGATQAAFGRLFGSSGILLPALTLMLTLYVAFFAIQLLTGRSRLGIGALTPRIMTMGLVLTFATSWIAYSQVVWNLALGAPNEVAAILTGVRGNATDVFAQKVDILFGVVGEAAESAKQQAQQGQQGGEVAAAIKAAMPTSMFSSEGMLWMGSMLLVLGTAGVLVATRIALAVMIALGPLFVVLALFNGTRGLFVGWLKGMVLLALAPLFAVLGGSLMLELAVPVINALTEVPGQLDPRAAMAFFVLGVVHVALMALVMKIATTMVGGWSVFGLSNSESESSSGDVRSAQPAVQMQAPAASTTASGSNQRRIAISGVPAAGAANDMGGAALASHRTSHVYAIAGDRSAAPMAASASRSRSRGIGSRFRAAPARSTEKIR
jgi:type IV secretion system protein VirB6